MTGLKRVVSEALNEAGLLKQGSTWTSESPDLIWVIELDPSRYGERLRLDLGCSIKRLLGEFMPRKSIDCHVQLGLEDLPLPADPTVSLLRFDDFRSFVTAVLDLSSTVPDDERRDAVNRIVEQLKVFINASTSEAALRERAAEGALKSAFVDRTVRESLLGTR